MELRFPLKDVVIEIASVRKEVSDPLYSDQHYSLNQQEFSMDVPGVAWFYASDGEFISVLPAPEADISSIELYLNGSVYGAILHQRKIMPLHGSSFSIDGIGIMLCGDAGAGKSSVTASFCLNGAEFLTDDVTPLLFKEGEPYIRALSDRIKLWSDTLKQLDQAEAGLFNVTPGWEKYYYPMDEAVGKTVRLLQVYILEAKDSSSITIKELSGSQGFTAIRNEIYRLEYLHGLPENEQVYFKNLIDICNSVRIFRVSRPREIMISKLTEILREHISVCNV